MTGSAKPRRLSASSSSRNTKTRAAEVRQLLRLDAAEETLVGTAMGQMNLSARTTADSESCDVIAAARVAEELV